MTGTDDALRRRLSPKVRTVWRVRAMTWVVVIAAILVGISLLADASSVSTGFAMAAIVILVAGMTSAVIVPGAAWSRWSYAVLPDALDLEHGLLTHRRSSVPYYRVQHIDLRSGPVERWLGLTRLVIRTASATSDSELPGLSTDVAEQLRRLVLERAGEDDAV